MPGPLAWLLCGVAAVGVAWALLVPPFQSPDENSHFGYVQTLSERFDLPGDEDRPLFSTEQRLALDWSNADQTAAVRATKPEWSEQAYEAWRQIQSGLGDREREDGGGQNPASSNPPLYYVYSAPVYLAAGGGDLFDRLYLARLWSVLLLLVTTTGAWLLAGELFDRNRLLQLVTAALAGLQPMVAFISASVNPDAMLFAVWSIALWLGVRILKRGITVSQAAAPFAVIGLGAVTKATSYALLPAALLVLAVGVVRERRRGRAVGAIVCTAALAFAIPVGTWFAVATALDRPLANEVATRAPGSSRDAPTLTSFNPRELGSYVWQFYLPRLSFQQDFGGLEELPVYNVLLKTGWGAFGWLEVELPSWLYAVLAAFTILALVGAAVALLRRRRSLDLSVAAFLALATLALLAGLHWTEFRTLIGGQGPFIQGRYVLVIVPLMGAAGAAAISLLPDRRRALGAGLVIGSLVALQLCSLAIVAGRFYA